MKIKKFTLALLPIVTTTLFVLSCGSKNESKIIETNQFGDKWLENNSIKSSLFNNIDGELVPTVIFEDFKNDVLEIKQNNIDDLEKRRELKISELNLNSYKEIEEFLKKVNLKIASEIKNNYQPEEIERMVASYKWTKTPIKGYTIQINLGLSKESINLKEFANEILNKVIKKQSDIDKITDKNLRYLNTKYLVGPQTKSFKKDEWSPFYNMKVLEGNKISNVEWTLKNKDTQLIKSEDLTVKKNPHSKALWDIYKKYNPKISNYKTAQNWNNYDFTFFAFPILDKNNEEYKIIFEFYEKGQLDFEFTPVYGQKWNLIKPTHSLRKEIIIPKAYPKNIGEKLDKSKLVINGETKSEGDYFHYVLWDKLLDFCYAAAGKGREYITTPDGTNGIESVINQLELVLKIMDRYFPMLKSLFSKTQGLFESIKNDKKTYRNKIQNPETTRKIILKLENSKISINEILDFINDFEPINDNNKPNPNLRSDKMANINNEEMKKLSFLMIFISIIYDELI